MAKAGPTTQLSPRERALKRALEDTRARCDVSARRALDPVGVVHRYDEPRDCELVALIAACVAFGNVKTIRAKLDDALERLGPGPACVADDELLVFARLHGWIDRVFLGEDLARLVIGARRVQRAHGSLGARFQEDLIVTRNLRGALAGFCDAIRRAGGLPAPRGSPLAVAKPGHPLAGANGARREKDGPAPKARRGPSHILPDPHGSSGSKRLLLFLRWMIRPADGVDLGLWPLSPRVLLCPVDTHIHKISKNLGFTKRKDLSWRTAEEITRALARFDPADPVKYDFSLCHLGMLQRCPSRRDPKRCEGCAVMPVCRHWSR